MTLRQKRLLEELPKNNYNLSKSGIKAGYSPSYANSDLGTQLRKSKNVQEYFTEATVKRDIKKVKKLVLKSKDYTNFLRATELESKILGMQIDKSENKTEVTINADEKIELNRIRGSLLSSIN